jgi:hypothetical protein
VTRPRRLLTAPDTSRRDVRLAALRRKGTLAVRYPDPRRLLRRVGRGAVGRTSRSRKRYRCGHARACARRLRRDLRKAGIFRMVPIEVPATKSGTRTDLGKQAQGIKLAPNPLDPLYFETATSLPVDFHSFRRAFASALAEAGVNVQHAMHLTAHSDPRVHARYVMRTPAMRTIPPAAIPRLHAGLLPAPVRDDSRDESTLATPPPPLPIVTRHDDSPEPEEPAEAADVVTARPPAAFFAPTAGLEPATRRLTAACSTN